MGSGPKGRGLGGRNVTMKYFAFVLSRLLDRSVIDRTGLPGYYDVSLDFARDPLPGARPTVESRRPADGPSVFTALREQLGLRLDSTKGPVEFLVIEHVQRPSAN